MACDWSARLDARGYHATPTKRRNTAARWDCATCPSEQDGWPEGDKIIAYDPEDPNISLSLAVGDYAYLSNDRKGRPAEIALIDAFYENTKGEIWMLCTFLWRPERIYVPDELEWHERELYIETGVPPDENSVAAIELTRVTIVLTASHHTVMTDAPHTFFARRHYNVKAQEFNMIPGLEEQRDTGGAQEQQMEEEPAAGAEPAAAAHEPRAQAKPRRNELKERVVALEGEVALIKSELAQLMPLLARVRMLEAHCGIGEGA